MIEIWIQGRLFCEIPEEKCNEDALYHFERIVKKAGYTIQEKQENGKIIKMI